MNEQTIRTIVASMRATPAVRAATLKQALAGDAHVLFSLRAIAARARARSITANKARPA